MLSRSKIVLILMLASTGPAFAYIDPVTGSILFQTIVGGVAAALVAWRAFRDRIVSWVGFRKSDTSKALPSSEK
jgi:hypothetical protein